MQEPQDVNPIYKKEKNGYSFTHTNKIKTR